VDMERLSAHGWDVVRRVTGGRAILHVDELTYSVTGSADEPVLTGGVLESYNRLARALLHAVKSLSVPVEMKEHEDGHTQQNLNPVCFEVPSTYEITVDGKKLIGSAQARKKEGLLQHGSLPLACDLTRICDALFFESESARQNAKERLLTRATTVESVLGVSVPWERAANSFVQGFEKELGIQFEVGEMSPAELERAGELARTKYAHSSWTERN
jgi:lipoyl(octanoyl) transferase